MSWGDIQIDPPRSDPFQSTLRRFLAISRIVAKVLLVYVTVVIPVMSFAMTWNELPEPPEWQSGDLYAWLSFFLMGRIAYVFFPLLIYAVVCLLLVLFQRQRFGKLILIRGGVYSGVLLGLHFSMVFTVAVTEAPTWLAAVSRYPVVAFFAISAGVMGLAIAQGAVLLIVAFHRRFGSKWMYIGIALFSICAAGIGVALSSPRDVVNVTAAPFVVIFFVSLLCGTYWFLAAFVFVAFDIRRENWDRGQFRVSPILVLFPGLGAYLAACRAALDMAWQEYQKLPTSPPGNCYIATAAARGHPAVVQSQVVRLSDGRLLIINRQLQTLKCGEIALRTLCPNIHRMMRRSYDRWGPRLAHGLARPLLADMAYFLLKPCEWLTALALTVLSPTWSERARQFYID